MNSDRNHCRACGAPLHYGAVEGFCSRCVGSMLLESDPRGSPAPTDESRKPAVRQFGEYELGEEIGRGGMGVVYRAWQPSLKRTVAVKVLLQGPHADSRSIRRFKVEATAAARLRHPNIVAIHEIGEHDGRHFFAMDLIAGRDLAELLQTNPGLPPRRVATIVGKIARAVHYAHQQGVIHRDLKPSNVLIDTSDEPHLTDFGLAKELTADTKLTVTGQVLGSPNYMPPEQAEARHELVGVRSDVYSIGAMLYHLLTGRLPFSGGGVAATIQQVLTQEPTSPHVLEPSVPADLETICLKCLEKEPTGRYGSAAELADELDRYLRDEPIQARPASALERAWRWCRRRPVVAGLGAASSLLLVGIAIVSTLAAARGARSRDTIEANLYAADMLGAQQAAAQGDFKRADTLLENHRPKPGGKDRRGFEWFLLREQRHLKLHTVLLAQTNALLAFAYHAEAQRVAVIDSERLQIVALADARRIRMWGLPKKNPGRIVAFASIDTVATTERDGLLIHDLNTGEQRLLAVGPCDVVAFTPDGSHFAICDVGSNVSQRLPVPVRVLSYPEGREVARFPEGGGLRMEWEGAGGIPVESRKAPRMSTADLMRSGALRIIDSRHQLTHLKLETGVITRREPSTPDLAETAWYLSRSQLLVESYQNGTLEVRSLGYTNAPWRIPNSPGQAVCYSANWEPIDLSVLAFSGADRSIHLRKVGDGTELGRLHGHTDVVTSVEFLPQIWSILSCGRDGKLILWDVSHYRRRWDLDLKREIASRNDSVADGSPRPLWSRDGQYFTLGSLGPFLEAQPTAFPPSFEVMVAVNKGRLMTVPGKPVAFSPDSQNLLVDLSPRGIQLLSVPGWTNRLRFRLPMNAGRSGVHLSPDGRFLAAADAVQQLLVFDTATGEFRATNRLTTLRFNFVGSEPALIVESTNQVVHWNFLSGSQRSLWEQSVEVIAISADGQTAALGNTTHDIAIIDIPSGQRRASFPGHHGPLRALAFAPDGRTLASSSEDRTVRFWNLATGREVGVLPQDVPVRQLWFNPAGTMLIVGTSLEYEFWMAPRDRPNTTAEAVTTNPPRLDAVAGGRTVWDSAPDLAKRFPP